MNGHGGVGAWITKAQQNYPGNIYLKGGKFLPSRFRSGREGEEGGGSVRFNLC